MRVSDAGTTSPTLLRRAADWRDLAAWHEMFRRYDPLLREWCGRILPDDSEVAEVSQRVWIELADRMTTFRYDPSRSFRGWLRELCRCRLLDFLRRRKREKTRVEEIRAIWEESVVPSSPVEEREPDEGRLFILEEGRLAQAAVRSRVEPKTWNVYWWIAVEERTIKETAEAFGMTYTAAFAAYSRVDRRLRAEGERRLAALRERGASA